MANATFLDFEEQAILRAIPIPSDVLSLPVDEGLYVDIWRHLAASYRISDRSRCPGFVSYAVPTLQSGRMVSSPLVPRFDQTSSLVLRSVDALLQTMSAVQDTGGRSFDTVLFTSFDRDDFTKVTLDPGMFFRDASSRVLYYYRLEEIIAAFPSTKTLCLAYKQMLCVVLQTPLPVPTCVHPYVDQTTALARVLNAPDIRGCRVQTASDLPYPYVLVAGQRASFTVRPSGTSTVRVRTCEVGLSDSSGGVVWSPVEWSVDADAAGIKLVYALGVSNTSKVHVFRICVDADAVLISYTHPRQHATLPICTGILCTVQTKAFYQSIRYQLRFSDAVPAGAKWAIRIVSSTGHRFDTAPTLASSGPFTFDYTVEEGSTNTAMVSLILGAFSKTSNWKTSVASPFDFSA